MNMVSWSIQGTHETLGTSALCPCGRALLAVRGHLDCPMAIQVRAQGRGRRHTQPAVGHAVRQGQEASPSASLALLPSPGPAADTTNPELLSVFSWSIKRCHLEAVLIRDNGQGVPTRRRLQASSHHHTAPHFPDEETSQRARCPAWGLAQGLGSPVPATVGPSSVLLDCSDIT